MEDLRTKGWGSGWDLSRQPGSFGTLGLSPRPVHTVQVPPPTKEGKTRTTLPTARTHMQVSLRQHLFFIRDQHQDQYGIGIDRR